MDQIINNINDRKNQIIKGFYADTSENRRKNRVGQGYDGDAGVQLTGEELAKKVPPSATPPTKFSVKTGDTVIFQTAEGKRFEGRITRYPSNDKIELNYGTVHINKNMIVGVNGVTLKGEGIPLAHTGKEVVDKLAPMGLGQAAESHSERTLRVAEKEKLTQEILKFKQVLKYRALEGLISPYSELEDYKRKIARWKQLGGDSVSLYGTPTTPSVESDIHTPVENPEEVDKKRKYGPRSLTSLDTKVKDIIAEFFQVDTATAYGADFLKSPLLQLAVKDGFEEKKVIAAFENYVNAQIGEKSTEVEGYDPTSHDYAF